MTVRILKYEQDEDVAPQAILWRPLRYCTLVVRDGKDDLDEYKGASFTIGNDIRFDLRVYQGHIHADVTVTLYLPASLTDQDRISEIITTVVREMAIAPSAIAWQRGQEFRFGKLERSPKDRLLEKEARLLVLKIAASQPRRSVSIGKLREEIPRYFDLSPADKMRSPSRRNEAAWHIILRNTISSHRSGPQTIFGQGWATKTPSGLRVTSRGVNYLKSIGFLDSSGDESPGE